MSKRIVHALEAIEIDQQHSDVAILCARLVQARVEDAVKLGSVRQLRQVVGAGLAPKPRLQSMPLGDVLDQPNKGGGLTLGQLDLTISLSYVILLTCVGAAMFWEGLRAMMRLRRGDPVSFRRSGSHSWVHGLPLKMRFKRSKIYLSVLPVVAVGLAIGFIGAVMGIGGSFILIPILIYWLRIPTATVIGTSMVLTLVTMLIATMLHALTNHLVDAVLALILMIGGVTGAQFGARAGQRIRGEHLRLLLGLLILAVGIRFAAQLVIQPDDLFTIRDLAGGGGS